jgi:hypothetical protein
MPRKQLFSSSIMTKNWFKKTFEIHPQIYYKQLDTFLTGKREIL